VTTLTTVRRHRRRLLRRWLPPTTWTRPRPGDEAEAARILAGWDAPTTVLPAATTAAATNAPTMTWPVLPAAYRPVVVADLAADPAGLVATATGGGRHAADPDERRRAWSEPRTEQIDGAALAELLAADVDQAPDDHRPTSTSPRPPCRTTTRPATTGSGPT
jgi:hypothetical protein